MNDSHNYEGLRRRIRRHCLLKSALSYWSIVPWSLGLLWLQVSHMYSLSFDWGGWLLLGLGSLLFVGTFTLHRERYEIAFLQARTEIQMQEKKILLQRLIDECQEQTQPKLAQTLLTMTALRSNFYQLLGARFQPREVMYQRFSNAVETLQLSIIHQVRTALDRTIGISHLTTATDSLPLPLSDAQKANIQRAKKDVQSLTEHGQTLLSELEAATLHLSQLPTDKGHQATFVAEDLDRLYRASAALTNRTTHQ